MARVKVLATGVYADSEFRALPTAEVGEVIDVADGWYVNSLVADGLVSMEVASPEAAEVAPAEDASAVATEVVHDAEVKQRVRRGR